MWLLVQDIYDLIRLSRTAQRTWIMFRLLQSEVPKIIFFKWNVNWYLDIDFKLEVFGVILFLKVWTRADFFSKLYRVNSVNMLYSPGADLGRGCWGCAPPPRPPEMTCGFLIQLVFCKKKLCGLLVLKYSKRRVHPLLKKILDPPLFSVECV